MAYNWGQGNVDQWIEQGRKDGFTDKDGKWRPVPKETREYTGKIRYAMSGGPAVNANQGNATDYQDKGILAYSKPYQLSSSGGNPRLTARTISRMFPICRTALTPSLLSARDGKH
jgi:hypothetical protein